METKKNTYCSFQNIRVSLFFVFIHDISSPSPHDFVNVWPFNVLYFTKLIVNLLLNKCPYYYYSTSAFLNSCKVAGAELRSPTHLPSLSQAQALWNSSLSCELALPWRIIVQSDDSLKMGQHYNLKSPLRSKSITPLFTLSSKHACWYRFVLLDVYILLALLIYL